MKKKIVSKVFALLLAACTVLSACGNESGNQSVGQTDKSETNDTVQEGEEPYTIVYVSYSCIHAYTGWKIYCGCGLRS